MQYFPKAKSLACFKGEPDSYSNKNSYKNMFSKKQIDKPSDLKRHWYLFPFYLTGIKKKLSLWTG